MIQRFQDRVPRKMTPEKRTLNTAVMKTLSRSDLKVVNKENEDPLNNNMAPAFAFVHSTPLKRDQITDLDDVDPMSNEDVTPTEEGVRALDESGQGSDNAEGLERHSEPELVIAKIYELTSSVKNSPVLNGEFKRGVEALENYEVEVTEAEIENDKNLDVSNKIDAGWKSLEVFDEAAEYEFMKSLEHSKQYLSTSNLLEEIEADLPSRYSLARPLNHTFHSLASYRTVTRLARMDKNMTCPEDLDSRESLDVRSPSRRLDRLETEAMVQQANIKQAQKALVLSRAKKSMEVENLESEKALLLANLRFSAACQEIEKVKLVGDFSEKENFGQITVWGVQYATNDTSKNSCETFICTATDRENVYVSSTMYKLDGKLCFDEPMKFQNLSKDFVIYIELFRRIVKETKTPIKACFMKKLKELAGGGFHKTLSISSSFNHGFECIACAQLRLEHIIKRENDKCKLYFTESPKHPITGDVVTLRLKTHFNTQMKKCGFLNVFKSTWHRRWYSLSGHFLNSWLYPEDQENDKLPIDSIHLSTCKELIRPADLEICIRPHSFVLVVGSEREETLFSAESHKDMMQWINHLNLVIENIQIWRPSV